MRTNVKIVVGLLVTAAALGIPFVHRSPGASGSGSKSAEAHLADVRGIQASYAAWRTKHEETGGDHNILISLGWFKGLSSERTEAQGLAKLDLKGGTSTVDIEGLDAKSPWDVWLIDNQPGPLASFAPDPGDHMQKLGRLSQQGGHARLSARLDPALLANFKVDLVAVTRAGVRPDGGTVLFGSPTLFQRLYMKASRPQPMPGHTTTLASLFGPSLAFATTPFNSVDPLVAHGANVFFNKKFGGNGRVCATCHPADHNFTIDPNYISTLAPNDPLFVAETIPALANNFEKPKLLRGLGLILENPDGFDDLDHKFVMRGVPHLLGLSRYLEPGNQTIPPNQRTGWGGDGAPGSGTLREFATGAVIEHYTLSLNRMPGVDFRLPTDFDLDGLEAFLLGLGRQDNPDIATTVLKDPVAQKGNELFQGNNASCTTCHADGGANQSDGKSHTFDIGVGRLPNHPANLIDPGNLPPDGGFGRTPVNDAKTGAFLGYGLNGQVRFKTFPAIEAVNTPPFFHNNAVSTIEEAVNYYNSDAFKASFAGQFFTIDMAPTEVEAIAVFLRVMDSLENIRSSSVLVQGAIEEHDTATAERLINFAIANTKDSFGVLEARHLHQSAVFRLKVALNKQLQAATISDATARNALLTRSLQLMSLAKGEMVQ